MTENKQSPRRKSTKGATKVRAGAWWKSVTRQAPEDEPAAPEDVAVAEAGAVAQPQQSASRQSRPKKEQPEERSPQTDPAEDLPAATRQAQAKEGEPRAAVAPSPKKRVRRPRRRSRKSETATENKDVATATVAAAEAEVQQAAEQDEPRPVEEGAAAETVAEAPEEKDEKKIVYKLLVNAEEPEECRVALLENGRLESFHVSTIEREATKNNIYKGRIVSIEPNLQVAFVDIGTDRNAFLPFDEIHPEYYRENISERVRDLITQQQWKKLKIEEVMQKGQEVLVQVVKEVTGNKGANVTTYLSLPGRCLVLLPGSDSAGISRKILGEERRGELRETMSELELPEGIGYIVRTASAEITQVTLKEDLDRLLQLWEQIRARGQGEPSPALIYEELDTVVRFLRDYYVPEIQEIVVDTDATLQQVQNFLEQLPPKQRKARVRQHKGVKPIFNQHNIEEQIESIYRPQVPLPSGGSIVINPTEALVAIDVNSGRTSKNSDFEESIFLANMEAAEELARQLRLRDLGGLIVVDFIDMRNKKHILEVERQVKASMKRDKAKVDISRISRFGLMQISRQKMGAPTAKGSYITCTHCQGRGVVRSVETQALYYLRRIQTGIIRKKVARVTCGFPLEVAQYLLNRKKEELVALERQHNAIIDITVRSDMKPSEYEIEFLAAESAA